jgi:hypothetical protein
MTKNHCLECSERNAVVLGFTDTDGVNIITAEYFVGHYVAVAHKSYLLVLEPVLHLLLQSLLWR